MLPPKLDFLFIAYFANGKTIYQDPRDISREQPLTRSAFYDVMQEVERGNHLQRFTLTDHRHVHTVFLDDGHFESDGTVVTSPHGQLQNYRVIYFRRMEVQQTAGEVGGGRPQLVGYFIGWQANDEAGQNFQMVLEIKPPGSLQRPALQLK